MDIQKIREQFPILREKNRDKDLIYLDSAATSLRPVSVIGSEILFYQEYGASIHRSVYELGEKATNAYENTRKKVAKFIESDNSESIVFTKSATESINLVADAWGFKNLKKGDIVLLTDMEHHSNIVPWQIICDKTGAKIKYIKSTKDGTLDLQELDDALNDKVKIVSFTHVSNVFGTINPAKTIIDKAHKNGSLVLLDGCQSAPHLKIDVKELDCDFFVFSAHKMLGPTGVGVLYGKTEILEDMDPYQTGGGMIRDVTMEKSSWSCLPHKFEAGSPPSAQVYGMGAAIDFLNLYPSEYETVFQYALEKMYKVDGITIYGNAPERTSTISFNIDNIASLDIAQLLDYEGITVRSGHHCCQPLMKSLNISSCARISFYVYNTIEEVDIFIEKLNETIKKLS